MHSKSLLSRFLISDDFIVRALSCAVMHVVLYEFYMISMWYPCGILVMFFASWSYWSPIVLTVLTWQGHSKLCFSHIFSADGSDWNSHWNSDWNSDWNTMNTMNTHKVQWIMIQYDTLQYKKHIFVVFVSFWIFAASVFAGHPTDLTMWIINRHADALNHNLLQYCLTNRKSQSHWL